MQQTAKISTGKGAEGFSQSGGSLRFRPGRGGGVWAEEVSVGLDAAGNLLVSRHRGAVQSDHAADRKVQRLQPMLGAISLLSAESFENRALVEALGSMVQVPGRLEKYFFSNGCVPSSISPIPPRL